MHKNESCSEDGNYYENQLAELMDLRQAVRLESNPNSSTSPSTSWTKTPPTMSTTTTTMKVMLFRKSQLSNQNYKVRTPTRDKNGISLLFEYYNQVRIKTEREKENLKEKKTSETEWIDSLWCALTKNVSALLCWTTLLPTRSQPWHLFWMVSFASLFFSSCFCFCMLTINHCWDCYSYQWGYDLTSDYDLPMTEQCAGTTNVFEIVQHNVKTRKREHDSFFIVALLHKQSLSLSLSIQATMSRDAWLRVI